LKEVAKLVGTLKTPAGSLTVQKTSYSFDAKDVRIGYVRQASFGTGLDTLQ